MTQNDTVAITRVCRKCKTKYRFQVNAKGYAEWRAGKLIQHALPDLQAATRELLMSGICDPCFTNLFGKE